MSDNYTDTVPEDGGIASPAPAPSMAEETGSTTGLDGLSGNLASPPYSESAAQGDPNFFAPNPNTPTAGEQADAKNQARPWQRILMGALIGMAGGAGAKNFGQGMAGGAKASLEYDQQQTENKQRQEQIENQKAETGSRIRFQTAQAASMVAETALRDAQLHNLPQQEQDRHNAASLETMKDLQALGVTPTLVVANTPGGSEVKAGLQQVNDTHNGVPPLFSLNLGDKIVSYDLNQLSGSPQGLTEINKVRAIQNQPPLSQQQWAQTPKAAQVQATENAFNFWNPMPKEESLMQYKNYLATVKESPDSPDKAANVAKLDKVVSRMQSGLDAMKLRENQQAADKAALEAKAKLPYDLAKVRAEEAIKDGDPKAAAQLLVNGDVAPSQIVSSRKPGFAQAAFSEAKRIKPDWNSQVAEGYFKSASTPNNVTFFGSAKSLTDHNGTLDQLGAQHAKLGNATVPLFNKWKDYAGYQTGDPAMAGFMQTALGVADDYAKVMGGGQGSDTSRLQVMQSFANAHNPQQMAAAISAARDAVYSQMGSRIGSNPVMLGMYGGQLPPAHIQVKQSQPTSNGAAKAPSTVHRGTFNPATGKVE